MTFAATFMVFIVSVAVSRILAERALRELPPDQKVRLIDAFSGMRAYSFLPLVLIVLAAFGLPHLLPDAPWWCSLLILPLVLGYVVVLHVMISRKLSTLGMPPSYCRRFLFSRHISHAGMLVLFGGIVYDAFQR